MATVTTTAMATATTKVAMATVKAFSVLLHMNSGVWGASSMVTISLKDSAVAMLSPSALSSPSFLLCPFSTCLFDKDEFLRVGFLTLFAIVFLFEEDEVGVVSL